MHVEQRGDHIGEYYATGKVRSFQFVGMAAKQTKKKLNNVVDVQGVVECFLDRYQMTAKYVTYDTPEDDV